MKRIKKILKHMLLSIIGLAAMLVITYLLFVKFYPTFGGDASKERQGMYTNSKQFEKGIFYNTDRSAPKDFSFGEMLKMSRKFFFEKVENGKPNKKFAIKNVDSVAIADYGKGARLIWFGHSAFLLQIDGKNILIDPMFGDVPAPHPWLGGKRFSKELPIEIEKLPKIDAVVISHDHYDHLDYESIKKLKNKVEAFFVPLGVGVHLESWDIDSSKILEMDWWQETAFKDIQLVCTPAQHFSGRKFSNRQSTLWSSWVIKSENTSLFFSGDSGYGSHFKDIGEKYGPFDFAMMECGQYNKMWSDIHMFPEQTVQAGIDVRAQVIMPIHWGAFKLALHSWTDPVERVRKKAKELQLPLTTPMIGESIDINNLNTNNTVWW